MELQKLLYKAIDEGAEIVLEVDVNGAKNVLKQFPEAISIFIMPPSFETLAKRLSSRGTESAEQIKGRLKAALDEIKQADIYDYIVVNDVLCEAVEDVISIIVSNRSKKERQINLIKEVLDDAKSCNW